MITQQQFDRLPTVLSEIVKFDRRLGVVASQPIVAFAEFKRLRGIRSEWRDAAARVWGHSVRGDTGGGKAGALRA